ncbi:UDP-4-amino-4-deoxy-L-arabinose--oxoglutarate aminotransferase [Kushneria pakistanensis]|uniref:UDP-4-amino-4-deoxy-L-arabinose--oxoglutarate aminotransferase n=1 Tax=Kushneria pakistanensis TaxID=1508770 RepID=A0ABQ3FQ21_9GAMM|nr:aminotransferase class I/II-fold pyridoxal phosphate-dependent enzyme [Kushneria pakistanensis]GHC32948.1 UDP-4-amino-4-deoxy-L-arabinose--oxoglutarate aminotransferase [Kushneria pakistanensis]
MPGFSSHADGHDASSVEGHGVTAGANSARRDKKNTGQNRDGAVSTVGAGFSYYLTTEHAMTAMHDDALPLCRPALNDADIDAVVAVLRSGWITTGARSAQLEQDICRLTGAFEAVALSSATAGMHLALLALGIGPGDEVITPSMTWVSTVNMIALTGATPVFVDIEPDTLMTTAEQIEALITPRTRLIIPVHFAGASLDLDPIYGLAERHGITVIEDAAHALGARYKGRPVGARGHCIFSLHAIKNVTSAEGGVFTTFDPVLADRIRRLKFHGLAVDAFDRETHGRAPQAEVIEPGFKYNLPDISAALALGQLERLEDITGARQALAGIYFEKLRDIPGITPIQSPAHEHVHCRHLMIVQVDPDVAGVDRNQLIAELKARNIGAGIHFLPVHVQKYYRDHYADLYDRPMPALANTTLVGGRICSLPLFPDMTPQDVERVINALKAIVLPNENSDPK